MDRDEARKIATKLSHDAYYSGYYDGVANGQSTYRGEYLEKKDLVPVCEKAILTACEQEAAKARLEEAEWWKGKFWAYLESHHGALTRTLAEERLAQLRAAIKNK